MKSEKRDSQSSNAPGPSSALVSVAAEKKAKVKRVLGLFLLWFVMPFTAFFKIQSLLDKDEKKNPKTGM